MRESIAADHPFELSELSPADARAFLVERDQPFKVEILDDLLAAAERDGTRDATDDLLPARPVHRPVPRARTSRAPARSGRSSCSARPGAYWRGDEKRPMLQRVYGTAWATQEELDALPVAARGGEEARPSPPRRPARPVQLPRRLAGLGVLASQGPDDLAHARGRHARAPGEARLPGGQHADRRVRSGCGASRATGTSTARTCSSSSPRTRLFSLKPMNCPEITFIYRSHLRSYRDLPLRFSEFGRLHRNERSGTLSGLTRVRQFIQDDAHLYVRPDQLMDEIQALLGEVREAYGWFGLTPRFAFATKPDKAIGDPALWERAEQLIREAFAAADISYDAQAQGRHVLRAQDRHLHRRRARARMADGDDPGRPRDAPRALRPDLHRRERPAAAPDRDPPRDLRLARAVHRHPRRAFRRRLPVVGRAGPGRRHPDRRSPHRGGRRAGRRSCGHAACGSRSIAPTTGCRTRSASPRNRRCRTCWSSATARSRRGRRRRDRALASSSRAESSWDASRIAWRPSRCAATGRAPRRRTARRRPGTRRRRRAAARRLDIPTLGPSIRRLGTALCYPPASAGTPGRRMHPRRSYPPTSNNEGDRPSVETCASTR